MCNVLGLILTKWHVPPPALVHFLSSATILSGFDAALTWLRKLPFMYISLPHDIYNMIYMSQNNFKSSSTTRNWWKYCSTWPFYHVGVTSACYVYQKSYLDDSAHKLLMIPRTNFEVFDDSSHKCWRMIAWWKRCHPYTPLLAYIKILAKKIT